jgi:hypothetical protein
MRGKPLRGGSTSTSPRVLGACVVALAGIWLGSILTASAGADACPNAQYRTGASEHLLDCRAYEQVSPAQKGGLDAVTLQPPLPAQSSACETGEACTIAYMNVGAAFGGAPGNEIPNAYLAMRAGDGWQTIALTPPTPQPPANSLAQITYAFSGDLSQTVLRVPLQQLTEGAPAGVYNLFLRQSNGSYSLVTASAPSEPPQEGCGRCFEEQDVPAFAGASSDFSHVIFEANDSLVAGAPAGGVENLYETITGAVRLVGVLPDNTVPPQGATAGGGVHPANERAHELAHAISADGSRVLFEAAADKGGPDAQQAGNIELFDRLNGSSTVEVSAPAPGAQPSKCETEERICDAQPAKFWAASEDGSSVYFTSKAALTKESHVGAEQENGEPHENPGNDLYRYDVDTGTLSDLTVDADKRADPNGASVLGVVGSSADGSYVYFVATGKLATGAKSGLPNLYAWHETAEGARQLSFIATLRAPAPESNEEANIEALRGGSAFPYHSDIADWTSRPTQSQAYVTPDGKHLAFMSVEPLTRYDNADQTTGEADHEVFEYSAETGSLVCASCDTSGERPIGSAFIGAELGARLSTPFHQPRSLSDDGSRLFFSSPDPLVAGLSGGSVKVFEYEHGVTQLISGMEGGGEAVFLDASASGNDAFFATREQLVPTDVDELVDVYDARVDGGLPVPASQASCQGSACQGAPTPPPSLTTPISSTFIGSGNLPSPSPVARLTRKQLLARALSRCRRLKSRRKRAACVAAANRRYAPSGKRAGRRGLAKRRSRE